MYVMFSLDLQSRNWSDSHGRFSWLRDGSVRGKETRSASRSRWDMWDGAPAKNHAESSQLYRFTIPREGWWYKLRFSQAVLWWWNIPKYMSSQVFSPEKNDGVDEVYDSQKGLLNLWNEIWNDSHGMLRLDFPRPWDSWVSLFIDGPIFPSFSIDIPGLVHSLEGNGMELLLINGTTSISQV